MHYKNKLFIKALFILLLATLVSACSGGKTKAPISSIDTTDTEAPTITLIGTDANISVGDTYTDAGATALDNVDGDITVNITTNNPVDTNTAGTYIVTYDVNDTAGNVAIQVTRTVNVVDIPNSAPTILGTPKTSLYAFNTYVFLPTVSDANGDILTFSINNKPDWAEFNETTGELSGRPTVESNSTDINISVSDGELTVSLAPFSIEVLPAINLAQVYGEARQISTYASRDDFVASNVIDGDLNTINHTWKSGWLEIALPKGIKIAKVVIYNREGGVASRLDGAKMYMSNERYNGTVAVDSLVATLNANLVQSFDFVPYREENFLLIKGSDYLHLREVKIYGETNETFFATLPPKILKHITQKTFSDDNRAFTLIHDKNGTVSSDCGTLSPTKIVANVETNFIFTNIDLGTFSDCNITVTNTEGIVSNPSTLRKFTFFKVLNTTKLRGRSDGKGLDYVILADGFQADEMELFRTKAQEYADAILVYDSNLSLERKAWNIFIVETVSKESGADNVDGQDGTKVDTALDSYFWCGGISRLLCINGSKASFVTAKYVPQFDKVLIITNSSKYGGAGGGYATTSLGGGADIAVHELGHSLAGLADEYTYGRDNAPTGEPYQPNVTINNDLATVKWKHWVDENAAIDGPVGLYEGGLYVSEGVWRPTKNSVMRSLGRPFYAVNAEAWALSVYRIAGVTYSHTPVSTNVSQITGSDSNFTIEPSMGADAQKVVWQVDDVNQTVADDSFTFIFGANKSVNYNVKAIISDRTGVIRKDTNNYSTQTIEWNVTIN